MDARRIRHRVEYAFFCSVLFVICSLPVRTAERLADSLAWLVHHLPAKLNRRAVSEENIRRALPDLADEDVDRTILGMWQHLFRMVCEIMQMPRRLRLQSSADILDFHQRDECVQTLLSGRRVVFLGGHFGNWEVSVNTFGHFGFPMGVVARDLDNVWLHDWFLRFRESSGNWMISKKGGGTELVDSIERSGMASLLCDQDAGSRGLFVDFFGKPASTFKSIALLAFEYDAVVIVGAGLRRPRTSATRTPWVPYELVTEAIIDSRDFTSADGLKQLTQAYTGALEDLIRQSPEQYFWVHRRWKSEPRQRRRSTKRAA